MSESNFNIEDWEDKIFAYVNKTMSATETAAFEDSIAQIPALKEAVEFESLLKERAEVHFLSEYVKANWADIMPDAQNIHNHDKSVTEGGDAKDPRPATPELPRSKVQNKAWWQYLNPKSLIFGGLVVALVVGIGFFVSRNDAPNTAFFEKRLNDIESTHFPHYPFNRGATNVVDSALNLYDNKRYAEAEVLFVQSDKIPQRNGENAYGLYRAINALMLDVPKANIAIDILKPRLKADDYTFDNDAVKWYLIYAYLKAKDYEKARQLLTDISKNATYTGRARAILFLLDESQL